MKYYERERILGGMEKVYYSKIEPVLTDDVKFTWLCFSLVQPRLWPMLDISKFIGSEK